jgi:shikimate dehydrogenase
MIGGATRLVGLIGMPVDASLSPRMHNAAFAALGLDWAYVPLPVERERLEDAVRGLVALGFAGANVTAPYKLDVAALELVETDAPSVNILRVVDGRVEGWTSDAAIIDGLDFARPAIIGDGGAATAFAHAFRKRKLEPRIFSRHGEWPPVAADADIVVNATPERDEVLVELRAGQTLIDLPYPESTTAVAARAAGARVIPGLEVLLAQGAASFELWTGMSAPIPVMRRALGLL